MATMRSTPGLSLVWMESSTECVGGGAAEVDDDAASMTIWQA
jgi:hypothetical protein